MALNIPPLPQGQPIALPDGQPSLAFVVYWQRVIEQIEEEVGALALAQTAMTTASAKMDDIPDLTIYADHAGVVLNGELPRNVAAKRYDGTTNATTTSTWSFTVLSGSVTATIGASTGVLNITAVGASQSEVRITSVRDNVTLSRSFLVIRSDAPTPSGSGGGTSAGDSVLASINTTTHAAISDELTVTAGTAGEVALAAPLGVMTAESAPTGTFEVFVKWEWYDGAAWVDVAVEVASDPDCRVTEEAETGALLVFEGDINAPATKTGLTAGSSQKFRLMGRNAAGTRAMTFTGTASAVGS